MGTIVTAAPDGVIADVVLLPFCHCHCVCMNKWPHRGAAKREVIGRVNPSNSYNVIHVIMMSCGQMCPDIRK